MTIVIDLSHDNGPHWLSGPGKVDREAIRAKFRAKHIAELKARPKTPAKPETVAKLQRSLDMAARIEGRERIGVWKSAIDILDRSEQPLRDLIEQKLENIAGLHQWSLARARRISERLMLDITPLRAMAIRAAFRRIRNVRNAEVDISHQQGVQQVGRPPIMVGDRPLVQWAFAVLTADLARIDNAIRTGLMEGLDCTEIARKVMGSTRFNGSDGVTEITRRQIARLGLADLKSRG